MAEFIKGAAEKTPAKPTYDPSKNYEWKPEDRFVLDGVEFARLFNFVKTQAFVANALSPKQVVEAYEYLEKILISAVEAGVAVEQLPVGMKVEATEVIPSPPHMVQEN